MDRRITRRQLLKGSAALFAGALGAQALAACAVPVTPAPAAPAAAAPQPVSAPAKTLRIVTPENRPLEPQLHASGAQRVLTTNVYENLVTISLDGKSILPQLAESWERIDDLTWEFKLRQGVKFHSGDPFTAEAVRYSIARYMNPDNQPPQLAQYSFPSVEVVDDYTVRISTEKPDPIFLKRMAGIGTTIVNPRFAEEKGLEGMQKEADGTGPYRVTAWSLDGEIVMEAFEDYWGGAPEIKKVVQTAVVEPGTRVAALLAGEADLVTAVPPTEAQAIERGANTKLATVMANRVSFYPFVTNKPPTDNKLLRQACNYASNFDSIIANVLGGRGYRTACMSLPHYFGYNPDLKPYPYDPDKAKQLLEQAGYDGTPIDMLQLVGRIPYDKEVGEALAGELEKVGLKINLKFVDIGGASQALWENPDLKGFHHITWGAGTMDGDYAIGEYWRSDSFFAQKGHHYANPEFDSIIAEAKYELDPDKREKLYWRAEQIIYDDAVAIWGYAVQLIFGMSKQLQWEPRVDELVLYKEMKLA